MMKKPETSKDAADKLVKSIRRKTRQTYSAGEKIRIVLAGLLSVSQYPQLALNLALILGHEHLLLPKSGRLKEMSRE